MVQRVVVPSVISERKTSERRSHNNAKPYELFDLDVPPTLVLVTVKINGAGARIAMRLGKLGKVAVGGFLIPPTSAATPAAAAPAASPRASNAAANTVTVTSYDIYFDPKAFTIPANTDVKVELPNKGASPHDFSIDALKIAQPIAAGETKEVTINAPAGTYEYYCNVPGHKQAGMVGTMTVK